MNPEDREDLALILRLAARHGLNESIDNHFSVAVSSDLFLLNRYGPHWIDIRVDDILTVDVDGNVREGTGRFDPAAFHIHRAVHQAMDAKVVLHTHMPNTTAVACTSEGLRTRLSQAAMMFHHRIGYLDYDGLIIDDTATQKLREICSAGFDVILLRNHGVIVIAQSIAEAWHNLYFLERASEIQIRLGSSHKTVEVSDEVASRTAREWAKIQPEISQDLLAAEKLLDRRLSTSTERTSE